MAETEYTTASSERVQVWAKRLWVEMPREIFWGRFMKENDMNAIIEVRRDLEGVPGDVYNYSLSRKLTGAGVTGDNQLEGSEEQLNTFQDTVTLDQRRNAVRLKGQLSMKRTAYDQPGQAKGHLKTWLAEVIDDDIFSKLDTNASTIQFGGNRASLAALTTADVITPTLIDRCVGRAAKADPKIWPVKVNGEAYFVLVIHTDVAFDLEQDGTWHQTQRDAGVRGDENKIFTGRYGMWRATVIHAHEKVAVANDGGGGAVPYASNLFLGQQAGLFAWGRRPFAWEKEFDYGNSPGYAIGAIWGFKKSVFNAVDHALIALRTARTNLGA